MDLSQERTRGGGDYDDDNDEEEEEDDTIRNINRPAQTQIRSE